MDISPSTQIEESDVLATGDAGPAAVRGGTLRVVGYVAGALLSAVSAALLFRHLGVVETGQYGLVLAVLAIAAGLTDLGITAVGVRELSVLTGEDRQRFAENLLGIRLVMSVVGVLGAALFCVVVGYGSVVVEGVLLGGVAMVLVGVQSTYSISLQTRLRLGWITLADLLRQVITVALVVLLVISGAGLLPFFGIPIVGGVVVLALTVVLVRGDVPLRATFSRSHWGELLRDILPFSVATAAATIYFRVSVVLVSLLSTADQLGYFSASFRVIEVLSGVPALLVGAAFPIMSRAARGDHERLQYVVGRLFVASLLAGVWVALELALGAPLAIRIIGGPAFEPAAVVLAIQGVGVGAVFVNLVWGNTLLSLGRHGDILRVYAIGLCVGTLLVGALTLSGGARGAAVGTSATELLLMVLSAYFLIRARPDLFPSVRILPRVGAAAALAASPVLLGWPPAALIAASTAIYLGVLAALGAIPPELAHALRSKRSSRVA